MVTGLMTLNRNCLQMMKMDSKKLMLWSNWISIGRAWWQHVASAYGLKKIIFVCFNFVWKPCLLVHFQVGKFVACISFIVYLCYLKQLLDDPFHPKKWQWSCTTLFDLQTEFLSLFSLCCAVSYTHTCICIVFGGRIFVVCTWNLVPFLHCLLHILMYIFFLPQTECLCTFFLLYIAFHIFYMNIKIDHGLAPISGTYNSPSLMYNNCLPAFWT